MVTQLNLLSSAHLPDTPRISDTACGGGCLGWAAQGSGRVASSCARRRLTKNPRELGSETLAHHLNKIILMLTHFNLRKCLPKHA